MTLEITIQAWDFPKYSLPDTDLSLSSRCLQALAEEAGKTHSRCRSPEDWPRAGTLPRSARGSRQDQGSGCPSTQRLYPGAPSLSLNHTCDISDKKVRSKWNVCVKQHSASHLVSSPTVLTFMVFSGQQFISGCCHWLMFLFSMSAWSLTYLNLGNWQEGGNQTP